MGRVDIQASPKAGKTAKQSGTQYGTATIVKIAIGVIALGGGIALAVYNLRDRTNQFGMAPEAPANQPEASPTPTDRPKPKPELKVGERPDRPKSIGNAGSAKYLPDVPAN